MHTPAETLTPRHLLWLRPWSLCIRYIILVSAERRRVATMTANLFNQKNMYQFISVFSERSKLCSISIQFLFILFCE